MKLIDKAALVAEIERLRRVRPSDSLQPTEENKLDWLAGKAFCTASLKVFLDTLEVKDVDSMIHTIIAECCDWLAMNTNLSHDEIEGCRNLMLTVKDEQLKAQKGEEV